jgi:iron complex transport system substrate-binding protein
VTDVIEAANPERPTVFIDRAGGYSEDCCMSFGAGNFGDYVELAGGANIARDIIPTTFGTLNPEQIIASTPSTWSSRAATGTPMSQAGPGSAWAGADMTRREPSWKG